MSCNLDHDIDYEQDPFIKRIDFPHNFMFGVGTSAYQFEGAWNADGKGLSIWDSFTLKHPEKIIDGSNACVTVDHYSKMKEDVQLLKKMGLKYYRFSISWSRILPGGKISKGKSLEGIKHYNMLIDELLANGIEPFVTLFHWDLPNALEEEYMGFLNSKIVDDFVDYVDICFWEFGDRVKNWVTLNEPYRFTYAGYVEGSMAPGRGGNNEDGDPETEPYIVAYNLLNCHAAAYRKYEEDYKDVQKGKVGITLDINFFKPYGSSSNESDVQAVEYAYDFMLGWFLEPLTSGNWPKNMHKFATSPTAKYPKGRVLPKFSYDQVKKLIQSYDFLGINYYTANYVQHFHRPYPANVGYLTDRRYMPSGEDANKNFIGEPAFKGSWVYLCPMELVDLLSYIKKKYNVYKSFVITENGAPEKNDPEKTYEEIRDDAFRLKYIKWHLEAIKRANKKGINVMGYFLWSFMDSFEWNSGYSIRFGMIYVDYKNNLKRYPKKSAIWLKKFLSDESGHMIPIPFKRTISEVAQDDEVNGTPTDEVNGTPVEAEQAIEGVQKLKKTKV